MFGSGNRLRSFEPQKLIQTSMEGFWVVRTKDASILDVNEEFCNMVGYSRDELLTMCISDLEVDESPAETAAHIKKVMAAGYDRFETRHRHKQGHLIDLEISVSHTELDGGTNYVFARDITECKRLEQAIVAREQEFRSMAESSPDFIVRYDREGRHRYLNARLLKLLELASADEVIGKRPGEVWTDGRFAELEQAAARAVASGGQVDIEFVQPTASGTFRYDQIFIVPERDVSGQIVGTIAFGREISAIRETERKLSHFIANLPGMAYSYRLSPDGHACFPFISPSIEKFYGLKSEDVQDDIAPLHSLWHPDDQTRIEAAVVESARTMTPFRIESRVCRPGLPVRWLDVRAIPEREADGGILWYGLMLDITERKQHEEQLALLNYALDQVKEAVFLYGDDIRFSYANAYAAKYLGYSREELLGMSVPDIDPDFQREQMLAHWRDIQALGSVSFESRHKTKSGHVFPVDVMSNYFESGGKGYSLALCRDITERKLAEEALRASEERMRLFFERQLVGMAITSPENGWIQVNDKLCEILGYTREELARLTWAEMTYPDDLAADMAQFERLLRGEIDDYTMEKRLVRKDGDIVFINLAVGCVRQADQSVDYVLVLLEDITERKLMEERLRASEREFRALAENAPDNIARYDLQCRMIYINPRLEQTMGVEAQVLLGKTPMECYPDGSLADSQARTEEVIRTGQDSEIELTLPDTGEGLRYHHVRFVAERGQDGEIIGVLSIGRDITRLKRAELEHQAHARSLECMERVNNAIQGTTDLEQMMSDVLEVVLATFDCDRAFLVYPCDPDEAEFGVPMERTKPEYPGALVLGGRIPMGKEAAQMSRIMLDADGPVTFGAEAEYPLPCYLSEQYSVKSQMSMALHPRLNKPWQFGLHQCSYARGWTENEAALFQKIGWRLSDALTGLLMYRDLRASEEKFRSLAENMPDTLIRYDLNGCRTYVNPFAEQNLGIMGEQMIGKTLPEINPTNMPETYRRALERALATGERSELEIQFPAASGDTKVGFVTIAAERATDGQISGAIAIGRDITQLKQAEQQLHELTAHIQTVREEEKAHLAREIHDDLASTLAVLKLKLSHLLDFEFPEDMKKMPLFARLGSMVPLLENAIAATRRIITDMRPDVLDNLGLFAALKWQAGQFHKHTGIGCRIVCADDHDCVDCKGCKYQLDKTLSINLFRIFQEALTNVARHSGASSVEVVYRAGNGDVLLSISDNGCGLPEGHSPSSTSFGIRGMRERVGQLGGQIEFDSPPGGGFSVLVRLPLILGKQAGD